MLRTRDMLILIIQIKTLKSSSNTQTKRIKVLEKKVNNDVYAQKDGIFHYLKLYKQNATMTESRERINISSYSCPNHSVWIDALLTLKSKLISALLVVD